MIQTAITSPRKSFLNPTPATRNVIVRKSVYDLSDPEVLALRKAYAALQAITDNRGYQYVASVHGLNQYFCPHGSPLFLIWHRPYVLMFEQALQAMSPGLALPYWDWTSDRTQKEGLPSIFTQPTYVDPATGKAAPNPLYKAAITYPNRDRITGTSRHPGPLSGLKVLPGMVQTANRATAYDRFCPLAEQPHNQVHGWTGGTMGNISYAAFDPVFWVHHCFVEKLFCDWQDRIGQAIPPSIAGQVLAPFTKKTDDVWNYKTLGYRYAPEGARVGTSSRFKLLAAEKPATASAATFSLAKVPANFAQADLHFIKTAATTLSFEVRVFFNETKPGVSTPTAGNPHYAGSLYTFGHGNCTGDKGHCMPPDAPADATNFAPVRPEHHLTPKLWTLRVTPALQAAKTASPDGQLDVQLVLVDHQGKQLPQDSLDFEMLTLDAN